MQRERTRVAIGTTLRNARELRYLTLPCLDDGLGGAHAILARRVQNGLTALLLVLMQWVEGNRCGTSAPR